MEEMFIKAKDGYKLNLNIFEVKDSKGVVQIAHGMEEHKERYNDLARYLNEKGFTVVTADMRGHGKYAKDKGFFARKKGYELLVSDQNAISDYILKRYEGKPLYLFAHSMGTITSRVALQEQSEKYDKVIFSGYPAYNPAAGLGILLTGVLKFVCGDKYKSKLIHKLGNKTFNRKIKNPKTEIDWTCANEKTIKEHLNDPLCKNEFTLSAYSDLLHLIKSMKKYKKYKNIKHDLPILLLAGAEDPCTGGERGRKQSLKILNKAGFENVKAKTYEGMRHEIINETNNEMVYDDIVDFLEQ